MGGGNRNIIIRSVKREIFGPHIKRIRALHGEQFAIDTLIHILHDAHQNHDYSKAHLAISCLLNMKPELTRAVPELIAMVTDEDFANQHSHRWELKRAALDFRHPESMAMLDDSHRWELKRAALDALSRLGQDDESGAIVPALRRVLDDPLKSRIDLIEEGAVAALGEIGSRAAEAVPDLARLLGHSKPTIRLAAVVALGRIGPSADSAIPAILAT